MRLHEQLMEEAETADQWMSRQMRLLESHYDRTSITMDEGEKLLQELQDISDMLNRYTDILSSLFERSRTISPLWQRGERIDTPLLVTSLVDYEDRFVSSTRCHC